MMLNKLLKRLSVLVVLAVLGFSLAGCSTMHKRQTVEPRPTSYWSDSGYRYPSQQ